MSQAVTASTGKPGQMGKVFLITGKVRELNIPESREISLKVKKEGTLRKTRRNELIPRYLCEVALLIYLHSTNHQIPVRMDLTPEQFIIDKY